MSIARNCRQCGVELGGEARFCQACGTPATPPPAASLPETSPPPPPVVWAPMPAASFSPPMVAQQRSGGGWLKVIGGIVVGLVFLCVGLTAFLFVVGKASGSGTFGPTPTPPSRYEARALDPRLLASNPSSYKGSNITVQGEALTVTQYDDYTWVQLMARIPNKDYDTESVVIEVRPRTTILRGECYRVYAVGQGTQKVTRTLTGANNEVPLMYSYAIEPANKDKYGTCYAP